MTEKIRAMFLVGSLSTGGAERFVSNAVTHLDRARFKPYLALYRGLFTYPIADDVEVKVLGKHRPWHNPGAALRFARWIDHVKPHVVISAWSVPNVFTAEALRWARHRPVWLARIANNPATEESGAYGLWARQSYKRAHGFIAVCRGLAEAFEERYSFARGRVDVIYNATDPDTLAQRASPPMTLEPVDAVHIVAAGRLQRQKRFDVMLRALALARAEANVHLHVLGSGTEEQALRQLARELAVENHVTWHGFQDNPYRYFAASDLFLLTSDYEGMSNALLEGQALGLPAVVTDCPFGSAEVVVNEETGYICNVGDHGAIASRVIELARNHLARRAMAAAARARISQLFSLKTMVRDVERVIEESTLSASVHSASESSR